MQKRAVKEEERKRHETKKKTKSKMKDINSTISTTSNGLYNLIKKHIWSDWINKKNPKNQQGHLSGSVM